jgi:hypothetical protein
VAAATRNACARPPASKRSSTSDWPSTRISSSSGTSTTRRIPPNLEPLLAGTPLKDISTHPAFDDGGFAGTFGTQGANNRVDFLLLSPDLMDKLTAGGIMRKGVFSAGHRWPVFDTVTAKGEQASDHAAIWAKLDVD